MDYTTLTDQINQTVSSGISAEWNSVPGGLDKVSASAKGYAWGLGSGKVWICQLPCTGNWKEVATPEAPKDVIADDNQVYVLLQTKMAMKSADNTDDWIVVNLPDGISKLISTASYIWGQAGDQKYKLPKPGMTGNWIPVKDDLNVQVTSASSKNLYGVKDGQAMVTDEAMQTSWSVIPEFGGKYSAIYGEADETAIYGIDAQNSLQRCLNGKCTPVNTQGYTPQNITIEPKSKQLWMTSTTPGKSGNIFSQNMVTDYSEVLQKVDPIDKKRDIAVTTVEQDYQQTTLSGMMSKQFEYLKKMLEQLFQMKPASEIQADEKVLEREIKGVNAELKTFSEGLLFVQCLVVVMALIAILYAALGSFGIITDIVALGLLAGGIYFFATHK